MKRKILIASTIAILGLVITGVVLLHTEQQPSLEIVVEPEKQYTPNVDLIQEELPFVVNMNGSMAHGSTLTIFGTVPNISKSITGVIYFVDDNEHPTIVAVFQLTANQGHYSHEVVVNDDYLWKENRTYTISVQNADVYEELDFFRGSKVNNFEDSKIFS